MKHGGKIHQRGAQQTAKVACRVNIVALELIRVNAGNAAVTLISIATSEQVGWKYVGHSGN
jgi:hypothetical protein